MAGNGKRVGTQVGAVSVQMSLGKLDTTRSPRVSELTCDKSSGQVDLSPTSRTPSTDSQLLRFLMPPWPLRLNVRRIKSLSMRSTHHNRAHVLPTRSQFDRPFTHTSLSC